MYHKYYGRYLRVEMPAGSGHKKTLGEVAEDLAVRLIRPFRQDREGKR